MSGRVAHFRILPQQAAQIKTGALFSAAYGGVGSGKTFGAQWKMWSRLREYPLAGHYVVGADFEQLRGGYFLDFRNMLEDLLNWKEGTDFKYRDSPRPSIILTDTGARLRALSSELAERIRSTQIQSLHGEEPQTWHNGEQVWQTLVGRMRHSTRSARAYPDMPIQAWLTFNPGGTPGAPVGSWLHRLVEERWAGKYPSWRFDLEDNHLLENAAQYIQNLRDNLPPEVWPSEIHGHWPTVGGDVYRGYRPDIHGAPAPANLPPKALDPLRPILWTLDFNVGWMASLICQMYDQRKTVTGLDTTPGRPPTSTVLYEQSGWQRSVLYVHDEIFLPNSGTPNVLSEFLNRYGEYAGKQRVVLYGDASGGARSQTMDARDANRSNWEIIINGLREAGFTVELRIQSANPGVMDRINAVRGSFLTGAGYGMLVDTQRCPNLIADFLGVKFKRGTNDLEKDLKTEDGRKRTHLCLVGDTLVATERGQVSIADVRVGERVWTRIGLRRVTASLLTERNATIMRLTFSDGASINLTPNHPVFVESRGGFVAAADLNAGDECVKIVECIPLYSAGERTQSLPPVVTGGLAGAIRNALNTCIEMCGKASTDQFLMDGTSTTSTATPEATRSRTLSAFRAPSTTASTVTNVFGAGSGLRQTAISQRCKRLLKRGTQALTVSLGTERMADGFGRNELPSIVSAFSAEKVTTRWLCVIRFIAAVIARVRLGERQALTTKIEPAPGADRSFAATATKKPVTVPVRVVHVIELETKADVFDLTVETDHEFFANGILVSNSDAYGYLAWFEHEARRGKPPSLQSFMGR